MVKIRQFKLPDLNEVMEIRKISYLNPWTEALYKELYLKYPDGFLVAEISKKIVGCILAYKKGRVGFIKTLAVDPSYRKKGIGTKLMNFAMRRFEKNGDKKILLHTRTINKIARQFYKKLGFKILKIIKKYYQNGDDAYSMEKELGRLAQRQTCLPAGRASQRAISSAGRAHRLHR